MKKKIRQHGLEVSKGQSDHQKLKENHVVEKW